MNLKSHDARSTAGLPRRGMLGVLAGGLLAGCGFQLRREAGLNIQVVALNPNPGGAVCEALRRNLARTVRVLEAGEPLQRAQWVIDVLGESRAVVPLSQTPTGQITQVKLTQSVRFSVRTPKGESVLAPVDIVLQQEASYSEALALSRQSEQAMMYRDMQQDIVQQIMRRLATLPAPP